MPFLLTLARLRCAWLTGCLAFVAAAAASSLVCVAGRPVDRSIDQEPRKKQRAKQYTPKKKSEIQEWRSKKWLGSSKKRAAPMGRGAQQGGERDRWARRFDGAVA